MLRFGVRDVAASATDRETRDRIFPPIRRAIDNAPRTSSPSAKAAHYQDCQLSALSCKPGQPIVRSRESFCPVVAAPARKETNRRRSQGRRATALCGRRSFPDRADLSENTASAGQLENPEIFRDGKLNYLRRMHGEKRHACGELSYPRPQARLTEILIASLLELLLLMTGTPVNGKQK